MLRNTPYVLRKVSHETMEKLSRQYREDVVEDATNLGRTMLDRVYDAARAKYEWEELHKGKNVCDQASSALCRHQNESRQRADDAVLGGQIADNDNAIATQRGRHEDPSSCRRRLFLGLAVEQT